MTTTLQDERLSEVGASALVSIREMVAALEADRERLQELRDERDGWERDEDAPETWEEDNEEDAAELAALVDAVTLDGEEVDEDTARERIQEDALSCQVRSDWEDNAEAFTPAEFGLLLTTGGPAVRIIGELDDGEPTRARLEVQDWGTPWTEHFTTGEDNEALLSYARCFYFGE
jgi:hypothetical protein